MHIIWHVFLDRLRECFKLDYCTVLQGSCWISLENVVDNDRRLVLCQL